MSAPVTAFVLADREGTPLLTVTVPRLVVRTAMILPVVVAVVALQAAAPTAPWWPGAVLVLLAAVAAAFPDSGAGLVTLGALAAWWLVAVRDPVTWWALLASACVLAFHVAVAHAAAGPSGSTPTRAVVLRLTLRCVAILVVTAGLAVLVVWADEQGDSHPVVVALALLSAGLVPWIASRR